MKPKQVLEKLASYYESIATGVRYKDGMNITQANKQLYDLVVGCVGKKKNGWICKNKGVKNQSIKQPNCTNIGHNACRQQTLDALAELFKE